MNRGQSLRVAASLVLGPMILTGCADLETMTLWTPKGTGVATAGATASQTVAAAPAAVDPQQVRAPEVYTASALALWDGRRTVPGIWVAHPDVRSPMRVRIVNAGKQLEVDGIVYRRRGPDVGDVLTVSSDAAKALGMEPGKDNQITLYALRPVGAVSRKQRSKAESQAQVELSSHIGRLDHNQLLQLVAAAMRGMGYATAFAPVTEADDVPAVRAFSRPDSEVKLPSIRVSVRPGLAEAMSAVDVQEIQARLVGTGDIGVIVSAAGFTEAAQKVVGQDGVHVELVDLDGLMNIWVTYYDQLSEPDRALLRLQPIYFLAGS